MLGIFIALASIIQYVENIVFPSSLPFRIGIANIITLLTIACFGMFEAIAVAASRSILASILSGKLLGMPFLLGISGGIISAAIMGILFSRSENLGIVGVSVVGATAHNFTQLFIIYLLLIRNPGVFHLIPYLWLTALVSGIIIGYIALGALNTPIAKKLTLWKKESNLTSKKL